MNYGKIIRILFDNPVHYISTIEKTRFRLLNIYDEERYPTNITAGSTPNEIYLHFDDINTFGANRLQCFETINMGSRDIRIGKFVENVWLEGLMPCDNSYVSLTSISSHGDVVEIFDGKGYFEDHALVLLNSVTLYGDIVEVVFKQGEFLEADKYINISTVTAFGTYCDINGVPV